jgi:hypothetical protein
MTKTFVKHDLIFKKNLIIDSTTQDLTIMEMAEPLPIILAALPSSSLQAHLAPHPTQ